MTLPEIVTREGASKVKFSPERISNRYMDDLVSIRLLNPLKGGIMGRVAALKNGANAL